MRHAHLLVRTEVRSSRDRTVTPAQRDLIAQRLLGTQDSGYEALLDLPGGDALDEGDVVEVMAEANIEQCEECNTWVESSELTDDDGDTTSCTGCGENKIAG